jgi:hypothetical protein
LKKILVPYNNKSATNQYAAFFMVPFGYFLCLGERSLVTPKRPIVLVIQPKITDYAKRTREEHSFWGCDFGVDLTDMQNSLILSSALRLLFIRFFHFEHDYTNNQTRGHW